MTEQEYHRAIATFDADQRAKRLQLALADVDRIPSNINRAGRAYKKRLRAIKDKHNVSV